MLICEDSQEAAATERCLENEIRSVRSMKVAEIKRELSQRGLATEDMIEKEELVRCLAQARASDVRAPAESAAPENEVAQRHAKLCMDASGLIRKGKFGGIAVFDSTLEEQVGCMDALALRGMYAEHVMDAASSAAPFSPPNNPSLTCTPEGEFWYVVGEGGIDIESWTLKPEASYPTCTSKTGHDSVAVRRGDVLIVKHDADAVQLSFQDSDASGDWDWRGHLGITGVVLQADELSVQLMHEDGSLKWWPYGAAVMEKSAYIVEGRNDTPLSELLEADEAKRAKLRDTELIALRLYSGKKYFSGRRYGCPVVSILLHLPYSSRCRD